MAIPQEILAVARPKSTVVKHSGKKYYVIKRTSKYKEGRRVPVDIGIVGEIKDGKFVPKQSKLEKGVADVKDYGNVVLCDHFGQDILQDLYQIFNIDDADKIYVYALLQSIYGDITARDMQIRYDTSFVSEKYPGIPVSRQVIGKFLDLLGRHINVINKFMMKRLASLDKNAAVIIDGMLKGNNSKTNSFSAFSRKGKIKGSKDITLLYAMDYEKGEPLVSAVYPGNMLDKTAFQDFVKRFDLNKGVLVGDKGFELTDDMRKHIALECNLKYLLPIKRNLRIIHDLNLLEFDEIIRSKESSVLCKKTKDDTIYYYSFKDVKISGKEADRFIQKKLKISKTKTDDIVTDYMKHADSFGTIVFESNLDIAPAEAYKMYKHRWDIEELFRFYKNILEFDDVGVQEDTRLYGEEFINYLSTIITCRTRNYFDNLGLFKDYSFKQIMLLLSKIKKVRSDLSNGEWCEVKHVAYIDKLTEKIDIPLR